jgi:putative ABC transport system substrate-binding protein
MPAIYPYREVTQSDGLLSYGSNIADIVRQAGVMTGKVLKGAKPAKLPVQQPTRHGAPDNGALARGKLEDGSWIVAACKDSWIQLSSPLQQPNEEMARSA